jgi:hypothetical protein
MWAGGLVTQSDTEHGDGTQYHAPEVVTLGATLLRELRAALHGGTHAQIERLTADLDRLIAVAEESAWPLR